MVYEELLISYVDSSELREILVKGATIVIEMSPVIADALLTLNCAHFHWPADTPIHRFPKVQSNKCTIQVGVFQCHSCSVLMYRFSETIILMAIEIHPNLFTGAVYTSKKFGLSIGYCICSWLSQNGSELCLAQLLSRAENHLHHLYFCCLEH